MCSNKLGGLKLSFLCSGSDCSNFLSQLLCWKRQLSQIKISKSQKDVSVAKLTKQNVRCQTLGLTLQMLSNISHYFFQSLEKKKRIKKLSSEREKGSSKTKTGSQEQCWYRRFLHLKFICKFEVLFYFSEKKITLSSCRGQAQECKENVVANYSD